MALVEGASSPGMAAVASDREASRFEHLLYMAFGLWLFVGLGLDGFAHRTRPQLETFFTPWHAVFYSGFAAVAAWLAVMVIRRRALATSLTDAIPAGYELAVVGLGVFAVGGVGDGVWHTIFGIETSVDALLSPTHLVMLVGILLIVTAPTRAHWRVPGHNAAARLGSFMPVILSLALVATAVSFFFMYANGFSNWSMSLPYNPGDDLAAAFGVLATICTTVILVAATLMVLRRWVPPFATFTIMYTVVGVFMAGLDGFRFWWQIIPAVVGGLTADLVVKRFAASRDGSGDLSGDVAEARRRTSSRLVAVAVPLAMWPVSTVLIHIAWTVRWPPELWLGQIVMAALAALGLSVLAAPPSIPQAGST